MIMMPLVMMTIEDADDRTYIEQVYKDFDKLVLSVIWKYVKDRPAVEDIASDVWVSLMRRIDTLRGFNAQEKKNYIAKVATNTSIDYIRKQKVRMRVKFVDMKELATISAEEGRVDSELIRKAEIDEIRAALKNLKERDRELLRMKYFSENCSDKEIGEALGIATASVRQYLTNAKRALRKELDQNAQK